MFVNWTFVVLCNLGKDYNQKYCRSNVRKTILYVKMLSPRVVLLTCWRIKLIELQLLGFHESRLTQDVSGSLNESNFFSLDLLDTMEHV